jgi:hypothetical protein
MHRTIEFDEKDDIERLVAKVRVNYGNVSAAAAELASVEESIRSFHRDLVESAELGNNARFERTVTIGTLKLRLIGISSAQRKGWLRGIRNLFRRS